MYIYRNIDQKLRNQLHGPMHYKIGVKCLFNDTRYILNLFNLFQNSPLCVMNSQVSGQCLYTISAIVSCRMHFVFMMINL